VFLLITKLLLVGLSWRMLSISAMSDGRLQEGRTTRIDNTNNGHHAERGCVYRRSRRTG